MHLENHTRSFMKIEKMNDPPEDTPKLEVDEIDEDAKTFQDQISESLEEA